MKALSLDAGTSENRGVTSRAGGRRGLGLAFRFALREMRGGLKGFYIFLACIALGVAAIASVNSVASMMTTGIAEQGRVILGGDLRASLASREMSEEERAWFADLGTIADTGSLRSMVRLPDGSDQSLAEVKGVGGSYPLYGEMGLEPAVPLGDLLADRDGRFGAVAASELLTRLGIEVGDVVRLGDLELVITGLLEREPDALSSGFNFAPRLMISMDALRSAGLIQPGSLVEFDYKIRFAEDLEPAAVVDEAVAGFPDAGFELRTPQEAAPSLQRNIERFSQFLTLVGLTALIVGGVGVANAVNAYLDNKRPVIAIFKALGAGGGFVVAIYLLQILVLALLGIAVGLVIGAIAPFLAAAFLESIVPVAANASLYPGSLAIAALFGALTALAFALIPLGRTRDVAATALFRDAGSTSDRPIRWLYLIAALGIIALVAGLALLIAGDRRIALIFIAGTAASFVILRLVGALIQRLAKAAPSVSSTALRLAIGNIHRPGALTGSVVLSLGLGLTLLVTLATIDFNLREEIGAGIAERAPNFFFVDIQNTEIEGFRSLIEDVAPGAALEAAPMLRGRITHLRGEDVATMERPERGAWVLEGDRGITYAPTLPENSTLVEGEWWEPDHEDGVLLSFAQEEAEELGLSVGDTLTVNVLGRSITGTIANLRALEWESLGINFLMVFSPNAFAGAPHAWVATLTLPEGPDAAALESTIVNRVTNAYPAATTVGVRDALDTVNALIAQLAVAIRVAAAVALVASVLVLAGALAAGNRARIHDSVVLKTLGATRGMLMRAFTLEYLILGAATGIFAVAAGGAASWFVVREVMQLPYRFDTTVALTTLFVSLVLTVGIGLAGTWRILGQKAAPVLRNL